MLAWIQSEEHLSPNSFKHHTHSNQRAPNPWNHPFTKAKPSSQQPEETTLKAPPSRSDAPKPNQTHYREPEETQTPERKIEREGRNERKDGPPLCAVTRDGGTAGSNKSCKDKNKHINTLPATSHYNTQQHELWDTVKHTETHTLREVILWRKWDAMRHFDLN